MTFTDSDIDAADAQNASGGVLTYLRRRFAAAFLYADRVVDVDSLVMIGRVDPDSRPYMTSVLLSLYEEIRPAIEAGILVMVPDLPSAVMADLDAAALADEEPFADYFAERRGNRRGFDSIFLAWPAGAWAHGGQSFREKRVGEGAAVQNSGRVCSADLDG